MHLRILPRRRGCSIRFSAEPIRLGLLFTNGATHRDEPLCCVANSSVHFGPLCETKNTTHVCLPISMYKLLLTTQNRARKRCAYDLTENLYALCFENCLKMNACDIRHVQLSRGREQHVTSHGGFKGGCPSLIMVHVTLLQGSTF